MKNSDVVFQAIDWVCRDVDVSNEEDDEDLRYTVYLFGRTELGKTVHVKIDDFSPFFYVEIPMNWKKDKIRRFLDAVGKKVSNSVRESIVTVDICYYKKLYGFTNNENFKFIRIIFKNHESMKKFSYVFYRRISIKDMNIYNQKFQLYENNVDPVLRLIHIKKLRSCGWVKLKGDKYTVNNPKLSTCEIDVTTNWDNLIPIAKDKIAPFLIASFDIECNSIYENMFPKANRSNSEIEKIKTERAGVVIPDGYNGDNVIQIGTTFSEFGSNKIIYKHIITLKSCDEIDGAVVESYESERDVLLAWTRLIKRTNPDIITGYNIFGFDMDYMYQRAKILGCVKKFMKFSRLLGETSNFVNKGLSSSAKGNNNLKYINMVGRIPLDLLKIVQFEHRFADQRLNFVAKHFLGKSKEDLPIPELFRLFKGNSADRQKIAIYCIQDCALCNLLIDKLDLIPKKLSMASVCSVPLSFLIFRGEGIKVFSFVAKECRKEGYLIKLTRKEDVNVIKFKGAIVLEPKIGFYLDPIFVNDFSSLYPSCMISDDISHDRLVLDSRYDNLPGITYENSVYENTDGSTGTCRFAKLKERGLIPRILEKLLSERKRVKTLMKNEKDIFKKKLFDAEQLAIKVTCNSVYGQCGSVFSPIACMELGACTTTAGRNYLLFARDFVMENFSDEVDWIYGDTDSVFFRLKNTEGMSDREKVQLAIERGKYIGKRTTEAIGKYPHDFEYEKVFFPYIQTNKKKYSGYKYEKNPVDCYLHSMGNLLKRRDNAKIMKYVYGGVIEILMVQRDKDKAIEYVIDSLDFIVDKQIPLDWYTISKTVKDIDSYKNYTSIPLMMMVEKMRKRDPGNVPQSNERVPFAFVEVIKKKGEKVHVGENIEHPDYIRKHKIPIDILHYLELIEKQVSPVLNLIVGNSKSIFKPYIQTEKNRIKKLRNDLTLKLKELEHITIEDDDVVLIDNIDTIDHESDDDNFLNS